MFDFISWNKMQKLTLFLLTLLLLVTSIDLFSFSGGNGTVSNPYIIHKLADLELLADSVRNGTNWSVNKYFKLTNDIANVTTPIGGISSTSYFSGFFDGNNHKITLAMFGSYNSYQYLGLFPMTRNAKITNLIVDGHISSSIQSFVGAIVGAAENTEIHNCINFADITADYVCIGGIVGHFGGRENRITGKITNCMNYGNIKSIFEWQSGVYGKAVGGIVGHLADGKVEILNCINMGIITGGGGGIIGLLGCGLPETDAVIHNCINIGSVREGMVNGGIIGEIEKYEDDIVRAIITDCANAGHITAEIVRVNLGGGVTELAKVTGGIIGFSVFFANDIWISDCVSTGEVDGYGGIIGFPK